MATTRRKFIQTLGTSAVFILPEFGKAKDILNKKAGMTIQQVIDLIIKDIPGAPFPKTVDTIKAGDPNQTVTGIVTTMFATVDVIRKNCRHRSKFYYCT